MTNDLEETVIHPTDQEKNAIVSSFIEMRNEASFCDVSFQIQGSIFRAHRIVVSSWSRWLYALLSDRHDQDVISLDIFTPMEFGGVLDYMYGEPLHINEENAELLLKIIRRLELTVLEQKCWRFLLSSLNDQNCKKFHMIADSFDCPPLKLAAWRMIQGSKPGYSVTPSQQLLDSGDMSNHVLRAAVGNGLTGPGEGLYTASAPSEDIADSDEEYDSPSIFNSEGAEDEEGGGGPSSSSSRRRQLKYVRPEQLPKGAPAAEVVRAWAFRLEEVYRLCGLSGASSPPRQSQWGQGRGGEGRPVAGRASVVSLGQQKSLQKQPSSVRWADAAGEMGGDGNREGDRQATSSPTFSRNLSVEVSGPSKPLARQGSASEPNDSNTSRSPRASNLSSAPPPSTRPQQQARSSIAMLHTASNNTNNTNNKGNTNVDFQPSAFVDWREELTQFYLSQGLADKLDSLDTILTTWAGREPQMMEVLHKKYNVPVSEGLQRKLRAVSLSASANSS